MECLVCGKKNKFKKSFSGYLWQCQECGFIFVTDFDKLDKGDYQKKEDYSHRLTKTKQEGRLRNCQSRLRAMKNIIKPGMDILDIGCHEGIFLKLAKDKGAQVFGLEPNYEMVKYAQNLSLPVIQGFIEDFETERKFDIVTLFHVLEHIKEPQKIIKKIYFLLKPGGYLVLELPNVESYLAKKLKENWSMIGSEHLFCFSPKTVKIFLAKHNFSIEKISKRQFDEWNLSIKESLIRLGLNKQNQKISDFFSADQEFQPHQNQSPGLKEVAFKPLRFILCLLVKIFQRGDYVLVIAKKK